LKLLRELDHDNTVRVVDVILNPMNRSLYLVFDYAEYDLYVKSLPKFNPFLFINNLGK